ncbi:MAG: hypothetical protein K0U72_06725 [Gammaproteobacteria bacterium]|nr:hypothetical protein [Gammaproteobacteria bacterium]
MLVAILHSAVACAGAPAQDGVAPPAKVLFVGNSFIYYNNSLHKHYRQLVAASGHKFNGPSRARSKTISGGRLPEHRGGIPVVVAADDWDVVVLQGHSLGPIGETTAAEFRDAARDYAAIIREHGGRPAFFMTWAYTGKPEMTAQLDTAYTAVGRELDAEVVPVGLAFETVTSERPDIALRTADAKHPTLAGTYLAACTFFATLHQSTPEGLSYTADLTPEDATYLQRVAWTTVVAYRERESL